MSGVGGSPTTKGSAESSQVPHHPLCACTACCEAERRPDGTSFGDEFTPEESVLLAQSLDEMRRGEGRVAVPAQVPLLRLDIAQTLRRLVEAHGDRPWSASDYTTAADVLATAVEARTPDGPRLVAYLDAWGARMTTQKARWAAEWAAETVRKAMRDPSMLGRLPDGE